MGKGPCFKDLFHARHIKRGSSLEKRLDPNLYDQIQNNIIYIQHNIQGTDDVTTD